jgi:glycine/D-amino acid oxidase-like deaminating enzyme
MRTPEFGATNAWFNILPELPPAKMLTADVKADWAVLGAGVTGLAAARRLAEHLPDASIVLIDAERIGNGNSGRNSGFVLHCWFMGNLGKDTEALQREARLNGHGTETLRRLVRENQIECHWHDFGMLWAGAGERGDAGVRERCEGFESLGQVPRLLDKAALKKITGSGFYTSGVIADGTALMQPAAMCRGLAHTLPANVEVYENTSVTKISGHAPVRLDTRDGAFKVGGLLLCTNTFSPDLGFGRHRISAGTVFASLTRQLSDGELDEVGEEGPWGLLPGVIGGSTVRRTSDNRLLMRNGFAHLPKKRVDETSLPQMRAQHRESIAKRWPKLSKLEIVDTWGGILGGTYNRGYIFGELETGIWGSMPCNGANISRGTTSGELLADMAVGASSPLLTDQRSSPRPTLLPPEPILGLFARRRRRRMATIGQSER